MSTPTGTRRQRLRSLRIQDFRGIDALDLDLCDAEGQPLELIVLAADNGGGKTAILEAILLALGQRALLAEDAAPLAEQIRFGASSFEIAVGVRWERGADRRDFTATQKQTTRTPASSGRFVSLGPPDPATGVATLTPLPGGWNWGDDLGDLPRVAYFSVRRAPEGLGETPDPRGAQSAKESRRLVELKRRLVSAYYRGLRTARGSAALPAVFERIQRFWATFAGSDTVLDVIPCSNDPGSGDEVVLRDARPVPEDVTSLAQARLLAPSREDIPKMVPLDRLSAGQMALFAFAGPLIFCDAPPDIVLIDEPEQHLHVQWQRQLMPALRALVPTAQWIVATHSEEVLDAALSYERFVLVDDGDPTLTAPREGQPLQEKGAA